MSAQEWTGCYADSWKGVITDAAFAHPAKFSKALIERILDYMSGKGWIKKGDVIGDPFGGVGTGGIVAAYRGFKWVGVELEPKFIQLGHDNFRKHESKWRAMGVVQPRLIGGDSREFNVVVDAVLSSPPYAETPISGASDFKSKKCPNSKLGRVHGDEGYGRSEGQIATLKSGAVDTVVTSPPFGTREDGGGIAQTGENRLGRSAMAIVTSPPYAGIAPEKSGSGISIDKQWETYRASGGGMSLEKFRAQQLRHSEGYGQTVGQIANAKSSSVDAIISSPPYETISAGAGGLNHLPAKDGQQGGRKKGASQSADQTYGTTPGQIAHCQKALVDAVVSSPPYEGSLREQKDGIDWEKAKYRPGSGLHQGRGASLHATYGDADGQIGSTNGETYWQAMAKVYHACLLSLKPGGYMAIVVKDFVKDKKRMSLCDDTMRLLVWLGFEEIERIHAMLTEEQVHGDLFEGETRKKTERKSFFRRLHEGKLAADDARRIDFEEVLFVRKPL